MYIDKLLQVSSSQALTATAGSTDVVDLKTARNIGPGQPMWLCVAVKTALAGTSPTLQVAIETDDNSGFSSATALVTSQVFTAAPAGMLIVLPMTMTNEGFLRAKYTLGGTSPTATVDAWLTNQEPQTWKSFADALGPWA